MVKKLFRYLPGGSNRTKPFVHAPLYGQSSIRRNGGRENVEIVCRIIRTLSYVLKTHRVVYIRTGTKAIVPHDKKVSTFFSRVEKNNHCIYFLFRPRAAPPPIIYGTSTRYFEIRWGLLSEARGSRSRPGYIHTFVLSTQRGSNAGKKQNNGSFREFN